MLCYSHVPQLVFDSGRSTDRTNNQLYTEAEYQPLDHGAMDMQRKEQYRPTCWKTDERNWRQSTWNTV